MALAGALVPSRLDSVSVSAMYAAMYLGASYGAWPGALAVAAFLVAVGSSVSALGPSASSMQSMRPTARPAWPQLPLASARVRDDRLLRSSTEVVMRCGSPYWPASTAFCSVVSSSSVQCAALKGTRATGLGISRNGIGPARGRVRQWPSRW